jgi:hypothetical protein
MRRTLFMVAFWLAVLLAIGSSMQYWLLSEEEKCLKYCATEGMQGNYSAPRKGGMRFSRKPARPGECQCTEVQH